MRVPAVNPVSRDQIGTVVRQVAEAVGVVSMDAIRFALDVAARETPLDVRVGGCDGGPWWALRECVRSWAGGWMGEVSPRLHLYRPVLSFPVPPVPSLLSQWTSADEVEDAEIGAVLEELCMAAHGHYSLKTRYTPTIDEYRHRAFAAFAERKQVCLFV